MKTDVNRLLKFNAFIEYCMYKGVGSISTKKGSDFEKDIKEYMQTYGGSMAFMDGKTSYSINQIQINCENANIDSDTVLV